MKMRHAVVSALLMTSAASPALAGWSEAKTKHFIIYSEQKPDELKAYAERLERYDAAVRFVRSMEDPPLTDGAKVTIYVLPTVAAVQKLAPRSGNVLGFYVPRASGSVAFVSYRPLPGSTVAPEAVFQHEYMHHLMLSDQASPAAAWMVEGWAEFFGTAEVEKDGSVTIGAPPQSRGYGVLSDLGFSAGELLSGIPAKTPEQRSSVYGKGWLLSHYLTFEPSRKGQLERYLMALNKGEPAEQAARNAFGDLKALDKAIDRYAQGRFTALRVSPAPRPAVEVRALPEGHSAIMPVRIRSDRGVDRASAADVANDARQIAARYPADAFVQGTLAEAEFDVRDYKATIAAADRALALDPKHVQAMVYKGRALMEIAKADKAKADWAEVRRWFIRANRADTENAEPLYLFYQSFAAAGEKPTEAAVKGLYYAYALAPQDMGLRFATVRQLLTDGKAKEAEPLFAAIIFNPHVDMSSRPKLSEAMDKIRAGDAAGALAAIDADFKSRLAPGNPAAN